MAAPAAREREIAELARGLSGLGGRRGAGVFALSWWSDHLLARAMADPDLRARLFRFVDTFPALAGPVDVVDHLRTEFTGASAPWWLRAGLTLGSLPAGRLATAAVARRSIDRMARQFVVGTEPAQVAGAVGAMWASGSAATVDLLGEHTYSDAEAARYATRLAVLVEALGAAARTWPARPVLQADDLGPVPRASVSVKVSALSPVLHPLTAGRGVEQAEALLLPVLERAAALGVSVWFDMERYEEKALTQQLFRRLLERPELERLHGGIVLQAYLRDAADDLRELARWAEGRRPAPSVRLVKGAYWDTETVEAAARGWEAPVHLDKGATDAAFEELADALHAHHGTLRAAFATHNLRSLAAAVVDGRRRRIPDTGYELQLLYGMAEPVHDAVRRAGFRLRVYAPMGELIPGMAYLVRRLLENTANESFVRHRFAEGRSLEQLLAPPAPAPAPSGPPRRRPAPRAGALVADLPPYRPEPPAAWHRAEVVEQSAAAVEAEFARLPRQVEPTRGSSPLGLQSVDPADPTSVVAHAAACDASAVHAMVDAAAAAAGAWEARPVAERAAVLLRLAAALRARRPQLLALVVREVGKPWADADAEVCEAIDYCEYYARRALELDVRPTVQSPPGEENRLRHRGRGVCAVIAPWNFPLAISLGMTAAALVTGNTVVLKPAEQSPAVAGELVALLAETGLPDDVLHLAPGAGETGAALVEHPAVDVIAFTGSRAVGLAIVERAARRDDRRRSVVRVVAEMGGKNAIVVDDDADLDQVVPAVVASAFGFAGQKCSAASRLVLTDRIHDAALDRVVEAARALVVGPPRRPEVQVGPVIDAEAHARLLRAVAGAGSVGEVCLARTDVPSGGWFVGPTVVAGVDPASWLATDELFGPVLGVFRVPDLRTGLLLADDSPYALTAGVFTRSADHVRMAADVLHAGNLYVNRAITGAVVGRQPFGGNRLSGSGGKAGGPDYLLQFCDLQVVSENTVRQGFAAGVHDAPPR